MRRALLFALLVGGLVGLGAATTGVDAGSWHAATARKAVFGHAESPDVAAPSAVSRARDALGRTHDSRVVAAVLAALAGLPAGAGWWLRRERTGRGHATSLATERRTRAPPHLPSTVRP